MSVPTTDSLEKEKIEDQHPLVGVFLLKQVQFSQDDNPVLMPVPLRGFADWAHPSLAQETRLRGFEHCACLTTSPLV